MNRTSTYLFILSMLCGPPSFVCMSVNGSVQCTNKKNYVDGDDNIGSGGVETRFVHVVVFLVFSSTSSSSSSFGTIVISR